MKKPTALTCLILLLNLAGLACLVWFALPYLMHDTTVPHPDAMLPAQRWDMAGMALTIGLIPLLIANWLGFLLVPLKQKALRWLFFLPGAVCAALAVSYWIAALL